MKIKNLILLLLVMAGLGSCYKTETTYYEDYDLTITYYDNQFDFSKVTKYAIRDSVGLISDEIKQGDENWKKFYKSGGASDQILSSLKTKMKEYGYEFVDSLKDADVVINPVATVTKNTGYVYYPGYWYSYPELAQNMDAYFYSKQKEYFNLVKRIYQKFKSVSNIYRK